MRGQAEKIAVGVALALLVVSLAWHGRARPTALPSRSAVGEATHAAEAPLPEPTHETFFWPDPPTKMGGWNGELFTPPMIYYDAVNRSFVVAKPSGGGAVAGGFTLVAVKPELFRLQLAGYVGTPGAYRAVLVNPYGPESWVAAAGHRFPELGLTLKTIEVQQLPEPEATAVLWDERSEKDVALTNRTPCRTEALIAELKMTERGKVVLREGDLITDAGGLYRVTRLQLDPPEVLLTRQGPTETAPTETLRIGVAETVSLSRLRASGPVATLVDPPAL